MLKRIPGYLRRCRGEVFNFFLKHGDRRRTLSNTKNPPSQYSADQTLNKSEKVVQCIDLYNHKPLKLYRSMVRQPIVLYIIIVTTFITSRAIQKRIITPAFTQCNLL